MVVLRSRDDLVSDMIHLTVMDLQLNFTVEGLFWVMDYNYCGKLLDQPWRNKKIKDGYIECQINSKTIYLCNKKLFNSEKGCKFSCNSLSSLSTHLGTQKHQGPTKTYKSSCPIPVLTNLSKLEEEDIDEHFKTLCLARADEFEQDIPSRDPVPPYQPKPISIDINDIYRI
jgi:hypothetical protein